MSSSTSVKLSGVMSGTRQRHEELITPLPDDFLARDRVHPLSIGGHGPPVPETFVLVPGIWSPCCQPGRTLWRAIRA
jgi:hypothetical protein